jgi:hypothetical protein
MRARHPERRWLKDLHQADCQVGRDFSTSLKMTARGFEIARKNRILDLTAQYYERGLLFTPHATGTTRYAESKASAPNHKNHG